MRFSTIVVSIALVGCAARVNPFEVSDQAMMAQVARKASLGTTLEEALTRLSNKRVVLANLENGNYTDDELPEYMLQDMVYGKISKANPNIQLLERDQDILRVIDHEHSGLEFCPTPGCQQPQGTDDLDMRKREAAQLIYEIADQLAEQDVVVMESSQCCSSDTKKAQSKLSHQIVANEVGEEKHKLLLELLDRYERLYTADSTVEQPSAAPLSISMPKADVMFGYRVYDFGNHVQTLGGMAYRTTYLKLHVRLIDLNSGKILHSGFIEQTIEDQMTAKTRLALARAKAKPADFGRPSDRSEKGSLLQPRIASSEAASSGQRGSSKAKKKSIFNLWGIMPW